MILCDYTNDLGMLFRRVKPYITGYDTLNNLTIPIADVLLQISNYVADDKYYEVGNKEAYCTVLGRKRRLVLQKANIIYELDYYQPFCNLDWSIFIDENIAVETIPEYINDGDLRILLKDWS